jgi:hypothetical protein
MELKDSTTMNFEIRYSNSAFKHGITEADILWAFKTIQYDAVLEEFTDKYLLIGFDKNANLIEILYNIVDDNVILVFHAMKCRSAFVALLK